MTTLALICLVLLVASLFACLYRLIVGPHALDRVMAFDLIGVLIALALAAYALIQDDWSYLEISMGLAVLAFVGTVAVARFIEQEGER